MNENWFNEAIVFSTFMDISKWSVAIRASNIQVIIVLSYKISALKVTIDFFLFRISVQKGQKPNNKKATSFEIKGRSNNVHSTLNILNEENVIIL